MLLRDQVWKNICSCPVFYQKKLRPSSSSFLRSTRSVCLQSLPSVLHPLVPSLLHHYLCFASCSSAVVASSSLQRFLSDALISLSYITGLSSLPDLLPAICCSGSNPPPFPSLTPLVNSAPSSPAPNLLFSYFLSHLQLAVIFYSNSSDDF